tara:strand:+ start:43 stop:1167 length:1125 start_codon:yes stop_codon:yes gene_type:complete
MSEKDVNQIPLDTKTIKGKKMPVWHTQQELILKNWSEIGSSYRYLHDRSFTKYQSQNLRFALPVIVISTITGTANFAQKSFPEAWSAYVPLGIGFLNLTAGLITTVAQFLRVSELLEGHRAASIAYSKFSRNIAVELSLPTTQRTSDGYDFIVSCRMELDRLIEQSPNIPAIIVKEFASKYENSAFFKPDILDITPVTIYTNDVAEEEAKERRLILQKKTERDAILKEEDERRQVLINELTLQKTNQEIELSDKLAEIKKNKKNNIGFSTIGDNLDKLLDKIGGRPVHNIDSSDDQSELSLIINDLVHPKTMTKEKVQSIIEERLHVSPSKTPTSSSKSINSEVNIDIKDIDYNKDDKSSKDSKDSKDSKTSKK